MTKRKLITAFLLSLTLNGCVYRFTNTAIRPPAGIRSVAVEAVYDTSRQVLPHEILWESLQRAVAQNGRLALTSQDKADALLRAHITNASISPTDTPTIGDSGLDPEVTGSGPIPKPNQMRSLTKAGLWTTKEAIGFTVVIELWDLRQKSILFKRTYSGSDVFQSVLAEDKGAPISMQYLIYEESLQTKFRQIARSISDRAITDIFFN